MRKWKLKAFNEINIKITSIALIIVMLFALLFANATKLKTVNAENYTYSNLDATTVEEDLKAMYKTVPNITDSEFKFINFVEYGFTYNSEYRNLTHKLYVYIYTPLSINRNSVQNKIEIGTEYNSETITEASKVTGYTKFDLQFLSKYNNFYKFKIIDNSNILTKMQNSELRRYDIAGIELMQTGEQNATDYSISNTFLYSGFTLGLGNENKETLKCTVKKLDTISLDVEHTFYRTQSSSRGAGYQNQIDTVYFSVPKKYLENYGKLQRIKAEWYEFLTKDIIVTENESLYNMLIQNWSNEYLPYNNVLASEITADYPGVGMYINYGFNGPFLWGDENRNTEFAKNIYWLLPTKDWCDIKDYDPNLDYTTIGGTEVNAVLNYLYSYNKTFNNGTLEIKDKSISKDLLQSDIEDYRKINNDIGIIQSGFNGKSYYDFDADVDLLTWKTWSDTEHSFWETQKNWGFINALFNSVPKDTGMSDVTPIYIVTKEDMLLSDADFANKLVVNIKDVPKIRQAYIKAHLMIDNGNFKQEEELILFRFAVTDYYAQTLDWYKSVNNSAELKSMCAYNARESIFLDFDIIQLTFTNSEEQTIIAVVNSPIDIVDDTTPPTQVNPLSWLEDLIRRIMKILLWIGIVFAVVIALILLPYIISLIKLIYTAIKNLIKMFINIFKKRKKE